MEKRPIIKIQLNLLDKTIEAISWFALAFLWIIILYNYHNLPTTIASHFNVAGQVDGYGNKSEIFTLPVIATIIFAAITILNNFPHIFNYPTAITAGNALIQYTNATRLLRYLKLAVIVIFSIIVCLTLKVAAHKGDGLGNWFLPISIGALLLIVTFFIVNALKKPITNSIG